MSGNLAAMQVASSRFGTLDATEEQIITIDGGYSWHLNHLTIRRGMDILDWITQLSPSLFELITVFIKVI